MSMVHEIRRNPNNLTLSTLGESPGDDISKQRSYFSRKKSLTFPSNGHQCLTHFCHKKSDKYTNLSSAEFAERAKGYNLAQDRRNRNN